MESLSRVKDAYHRFKSHLAEVTSLDSDISLQPRNIMNEALREVAYNGDWTKFQSDIVQQGWDNIPEAEKIKEVISRKIHLKVMGNKSHLHRDLIPKSYYVGQVLRTVCFRPINSAPNDTEARRAFIAEVSQRSLWGTLFPEASQEDAEAYRTHITETVAGMEQHGLLQIKKTDNKSTLYLTTSADPLLQ